MKKTFTLILALALLTAVASAQENRLDIRAGRTLSFTSGKAVPGDLALASLAYRHGALSVGASADIPVSLKGELGLQLRTGFHTGSRRLSLSPFLAARCGWLSGRAGLSAGYGASAGLRLLGPLGIYAEAVRLHPMYVSAKEVGIRKEAVAFVSVGIQLSI